MFLILIFINAFYDCLYIFINIEFNLLTGICAKGLYAFIRTFSVPHSWVAPHFWRRMRSVELRIESDGMCVYKCVWKHQARATDERLTGGRHTCFPLERFCCQLPFGKHFSLLLCYPYNCITYITLVSSLFNVKIYWMHLVKCKTQTVMKFSHHSDRFTSEMQ